MITRKTVHPFYSFSLEYDETKTETEYEKNIVKMFVDFFDVMQQMREKMPPLKENYYKEDLLRDDILEQLEAVKTNYDIVNKSITQKTGENIIEIINFPEIQKLYYDTNKKYLDIHNTIIDELRALTETDEQIYTELYKWFEYNEDDEELNKPAESGDALMFEAAEKYAKDLYSNYDNYSLDFVSLDENINEMKEAWQLACREWDEFYNLRSDVVLTKAAHFAERINDLNNTCTALQKQLEEIEELRQAALN